MGEPRHDGLAVPGRVVLAHELPFTLGPLNIDPATRQLTNGGRRETLEPRVMQVLVALARANGGIVTRDELIERCWDGRIVTDDAINRVLSRIRHVAETISGGAFKLETITKVGYRLVETGAPASPAAPPSARSSVDRRWVIGGAGAIAALAAGGLWLGSRPSGEARTLYRQGRAAQRAGTLDQHMQAVAYFRQAVRADPDYAAAWGALALAYRNVLNFGHPDGERLLALSKSAAARALTLDPDNIDGLAASALDRSIYRNWAPLEQHCRRLLERDPQHVSLRSFLAFVLYEAGRAGDAIPHLQQLVRRESLVPIFAYRLVLALWTVRRLDEAETELERAATRWPTHSAIWQARVSFLAFTGRPAAALSVIHDATARPADYNEALMRPVIETFGALAGRSPELIDGAAGTIADHVRSMPENVLSSVLLLAGLGKADFAFSLLDGYYFGRGPWAFVAPAPKGAFERRYTGPLFRPPMDALHHDPRFDQLTRAIGLNSYWNSIGFTPAHLRA